jgi:hypothetical protein
VTAKPLAIIPRMMYVRDMTTTRHAADMTPREKLIARTNATPLRTLADALLILEAKGKLNEAERLTRATIIDSITNRCPAADAAFTAWAYADDDTDEVDVIVAAVRAA